MLANALPNDLPSFASLPLPATYKTLEENDDANALNSDIVG